MNPSLRSLRRGLGWEMLRGRGTGMSWCMSGQCGSWDDAGVGNFEERPAISRTRTGQMLHVHAASSSFYMWTARGPEESGGILASHGSGSDSAIWISTDLDSMSMCCTKSRPWCSVTFAPELQVSEHG